MRNLAGNPEADRYIDSELERCGIDVVKLATPRSGEIAGQLEGRLGPFKFDRRWYYWNVEGPVPLPVAEALYEHPVGRTDIRVAGHCGCPPPAQWTTKHEGRDVVFRYHIDSELGLYLFVQAVKTLPELDGRQWAEVPEP